jgi:hypothetical protein
MEMFASLAKNKLPLPHLICNGQACAAVWGLSEDTGGVAALSSTQVCEVLVQALKAHGEKHPGVAEQVR